MMRPEVRPRRFVESNVVVDNVGLVVAMNPKDVRVAPVLSEGPVAIGCPPIEEEHLSAEGVVDLRNIEVGQFIRVVDYLRSESDSRAEIADVVSRAPGDEFRGDDGLLEIWNRKANLFAQQPGNPFADEGTTSGAFAFYIVQKAIITTTEER